MNPINIKYRIRYYWRKLVVFFWRCPDCWGPINFMRNGRGHCPNCGKAK